MDKKSSNMVLNVFSLIITGDFSEKELIEEKWEDIEHMVKLCPMLHISKLSIYFLLNQMFYITYNTS